MKNIIILGEEYWFEKPDTEFTEASYLLKSLENHRDKDKYNYIIIKSPSELVESINKLKEDTVKAVFLFQDVLSDSYLNKKTILEMSNYLKGLQNRGIYLYPPPEVTDNFGSKKYNLTLNQKLPWAQLPHTKVYYVPNYDPKDENRIFTALYKSVEELWKIFNKVVVKKGYSYEGKQVKIFNKELIKDFFVFRKKARKLNYKNFWGVRTSSIAIDKGITRYYIIQGFNKIVSKRQNEYRVFFHNGKPKFIAKGDDIPNTCIDDALKTQLGKEIIAFSKKLFKEYIPLFWNNQRLPILFRVDVSYAVDKEFQDKYSINVEGFEKPIRLYANELEIDPTSFFYNKFTCKDDATFSSKIIQKNMAKYITKYIREIN
jgi:hypothetical protein